MCVPFSRFFPLADAPSLVELDLSHNFLREIPVDALAGLDNIKFLDLGSNRIQVKQFFIFLNYAFPISHPRTLKSDL